MITTQQARQKADAAMKRKPITTPEEVKVELCAAYDDFLEGVRTAWRGCAGDKDLHKFDAMYSVERRIFEGRVARAIESVS